MALLTATDPKRAKAVERRHFADTFSMEYECVYERAYQISLY